MTHKRDNLGSRSAWEKIQPGDGKLNNDKPRFFVFLCSVNSSHAIANTRSEQIRLFALPRDKFEAHFIIRRLSLIQQQKTAFCSVPGFVTNDEILDALKSFEINKYSSSHRSFHIASDKTTGPNAKSYDEQLLAKNAYGVPRTTKH